MNKFLKTGSIIVCACALLLTSTWAQKKEPVAWWSFDADPDTRAVESISQVQDSGPGQS